VEQWQDRQEPARIRADLGTDRSGGDFYVSNRLARFIITGVMRRAIALAVGLMIVLTCIVSAFGQSSEPVITSVCRVFQSPDAFDGKVVQIRARYAGSWEGAYLVDDQCQEPIWFTTPDGISSIRSIAVISVSGDQARAPEVTFSLVKDNDYEQFSRFAYATENLQPVYDVTATFIGRVDHVRRFQIHANGFGNGFGQMGRSELQFVLKSVTDVDVKKSVQVFGPVQPIVLPLPDHISEQP
jgi:hypothetical protein